MDSFKRIIGLIKPYLGKVPVRCDTYTHSRRRQHRDALHHPIPCGRRHQGRHGAGPRQPVGNAGGQGAGRRRREQTSHGRSRADALPFADARRQHLYTQRVVRTDIAERRVRLQAKPVRAPAHAPLPLLRQPPHRRDHEPHDGRHGSRAHARRKRPARHHRALRLSLRLARRRFHSGLPAGARDTGRSAVRHVAFLEVQQGGAAAADAHTRADRRAEHAHAGEHIGRSRREGLRARRLRDGGLRRGEPQAPRLRHRHHAHERGLQLHARFLRRDTGGAAFPRGRVSGAAQHRDARHARGRRGLRLDDHDAPQEPFEHDQHPHAGHLVRRQAFLLHGLRLGDQGEAGRGFPLRTLPATCSSTTSRSGTRTSRY